MTNLAALSRTIAATARPMSSTTSNFHPYSNSTSPAAVTVTAPSIIHRGAKSDLYSWREIFQLYIDTEVFESHHEKTRGERSLEDTEARLELFKQRLAERGFESGHGLKLRESHQALQTFLDLNAFILDLKKVRSCICYQS